MPKFFISYSRKDLELARPIVDQLIKDGFSIWIDWEDIPKGQEFYAEIRKGIEAADGFLFLLSPDSVQSEWCKQEIAHAVKNGKRILPVVLRDTELASIPKQIADRNWIFCRAGQDDFEKAIAEILTAIHADYDWVEFHKDLQVKALEWEENKKDDNYLLFGTELTAAAKTLVDKAGKEPNPTDLQNEYIIASQAHAAQIQAQAIRRRQQIITGLSVGLVIVAALAIFAVIQRNNAIRQAQIALARQLVAQAQFTRSSNQVTAVLLAIRSLQILPSSEASQILLGNLTAHSINLVNFADDGDVRTLAFSPDGRWLAAAGGKTIRLLDMITGKEIGRMEQDDTVYSIEFSPNSKYLISGGRDQTVRIWDVAQRVELHRFVQDGEVLSVAFSPDGKYAAAGGFKTIRLWDTQSGVEIDPPIVVKNTGPIRKIVFSQDGKLLASADTKTARVWNVDQSDEIFGAELLRKKSADPDGVLAVAFSPDGKYLVASCEPLDACVWDIFNDVEVARVNHAGVVESAEFSSDGSLIVTGSRDNTARVWEALTGREISRMTHDQSVLSVKFSPNDFYVVSTSSDFTARVWDASNGLELARKTHENRVYTASFSPNGEYIASGGADRVLRVWKVLPSAEIARTTYSGRVYDIAFSPDGKYIVSGSSDGTARLWDIANDRELQRAKYDDIVFDVDFSRDGKYIVSGGGSTVSVWDLLGNEIMHAQHGSKISAVAFSPDGKYVASGSDDAMAKVWDIQTGTQIANMKHDGDIHAITFSSDGIFVVSAGGTTACAWETQTGTKIACLTRKGKVFYSVAISPDDKYVISGDDTVATVWEVATGKPISHVKQGNFVYAVAFSPDGKYVVSTGKYVDATEKRLAVVWNPLTGNVISQMVHDGTINTAAFSPNGKYVISGDDKTARIWEALTGIEIARLNHDNLVKSALFSPDGRYATSGGFDKTARVWVWQTDELINQTCDNLPRNLTRAEWSTYLHTEPYQAICPMLPIDPEPQQKRLGGTIQSR